MYPQPMLDPPRPPRQANRWPASLMIWFAALLQPLVIVAMVLLMVVLPNDTARIRAKIRLLAFTFTAGVACAAVTVIVAGVLLLVWQARARRMADRLQPAPHRLSPGAALASWAVPVVNCWLPRRAIIDLARATEPPDTGSRPARSGLEPRIRLWWAMWLATSTTLLFVVAQLSWLFRFGRWPLPGEDAGAVLGYLAYTVLALVTAPLLSGVLRGISRRLGGKPAAHTVASNK
jgi:uncharacterized protein DUF4328